MTWTKLSDDYGVSCRGLSDAAFRTHTEALLWVMHRETGGYLTTGDVQRFAESPAAQAAVGELVDCGWWVSVTSGFYVVHHMEHQPEPDVIARRRQLAAERMRRKRRRWAGLAAEPEPGPGPAYPRDDPREYPRYPGRVLVTGTGDSETGSDPVTGERARKISTPHPTPDTGAQADPA